MGQVGRAPVVDVHLGAKRGDGRVGEEVRVGGSGVGPDYVGRLIVVPGGGFGEYACVFFWDGHVGGDIVEALGGRLGFGLQGGHIRGC